jgi:hypothetical protein
MIAELCNSKQYCLLIYPDDDKLSVAHQLFGVSSYCTRSPKFVLRHASRSRKGFRASGVSPSAIVKPFSQVYRSEQTFAFIAFKLLSCGKETEMEAVPHLLSYSTPHIEGSVAVQAAISFWEKEEPEQFLGASRLVARKQRR